MIKNTQWDIKTKIKTFLILFFTVFLEIFYFAISREWNSASAIIAQIMAAIAFSVFVAFTTTEKGWKLGSPQGILMALSVILLLGVMASSVDLSTDLHMMMIFTSLMLICSQKIMLVPVSAVLSVIVAVKYSEIATMCLPAVTGVSLMYLSEELKKSAVWKKILFAVSETVIIGSAVYTFWYRRYFLNINSLVTELWDSVIAVLVITILVVLIVISIKRKRSVFEIAGYIISAAFSVLPMFIYSSYAFPASVAGVMMLVVICRNGLPMEELGEKSLKFICSKIKR